MNDNLPAFVRMEEDAPPPFDPPDDLNDIFGAAGADLAEEETDFAEDEPVLFSMPPECVTPDANEAGALALNEAVTELVPAALAFEACDEEPPFDPPVAGDDGFGDLDEATLAPTPRAPAPSPEPPAGAPGSALPPPLAAFATSRPPQPEIRPSERPLPAISIFAAWDRPDVGAVLERFAGDRRASRAEIVVERGGIDAAAVRFTLEPCANLLLLDTNLRRAEMLAALDRLAPSLEQGAKLIVLGALNDVGLLRELAQRGVSEYIVPPITADALMRTACGLYAETDTSRVVAVVGARGGVGASAVAHNLAWTIAERHEIGATLVDLDLSFGTAAFAFKHAVQHSVTDLLGVDDAAPMQHSERLQVLTAPAALEPAAAIDAEVMHILVERARRTSPYIVLDLPHAWTGWVKQTLIDADDVMVVASPDLASLRNAKSMLELLKPARAGKSEPLVVLNMTGVPKRPEIMAKDFSEAVGVAPAVTIPFEPELFGVADISGRMLGDVAPGAKAAAAFDQLATAITGRSPGRRRPAAANQALTFADTMSPLLLSEPAPADVAPYLTQARSAAEQDFTEQRAERRQKARRSLGRALAWAAGAALLAALGAWHLQNRDQQAQAAVPAPTMRVAAPDYETQYRAALAHLNEGRAEQGAVMLLRAAEAGYAPAQHRLAKLYERGEGVSTDLAAARRWTERAAAAGNRRAMHDLGVYLAQGEGAARDDAAAFRWFRQAAEFGVADSQYNLGVFYQEGRGVSADPAEALFWFTTAAAQGDVEARTRASALSAALSPLENERARARARAFTPRAPHPAANAEPVASGSAG